MQAPDAAPQLAPTAALLQGFVLDDAPAAASPRAGRRDAADAAREGFRVGELRLMIRFHDGSELADVPPTTRLPHAPDWFVGMANLHGALLPVFDLARWLGLERPDAARARLLVLAHGNDAAGVLIDGLPERLRVDAAEGLDESVVPAALAGCVERACMIDAQPWLDLDVRALLARLEGELAS